MSDTPPMALEPPSEATLDALFQSLSNWGRWGVDDELGMLNHLGPAQRMAAVQEVQVGRSISLARDLADQGIAVAQLHPGFVRTEMTGGNGLIDAPEAATGLIARIEELTIGTSGSFWHANGERLPW